MSESFASKDTIEYITSSELAKAAEASKEEWSKKLEKYYETAYGQQVKKYVENPVQEAVVYGVRRSADVLRVECYSPFWGDTNICLVGEQRFQDFQRCAGLLQVPGVHRRSRQQSEACRPTGCLPVPREYSMRIPRPLRNDIKKVFRFPGYARHPDVAGQRD